jgi:small multidrug resistance pump
MAWLLLAAAILIEVGATTSLKVATTRDPRWYVVVAVGYVLAFALLSAVLAQGIGIGVAYGIWTAAGVALTAVVSRFLFEEPLTWVMGVGIVLIATGVLLIEIGAAL